MTFEQSLMTMLSEPTPTVLFRLRGDLLSGGLAIDGPAMGVLDSFYTCLNNLIVNISAHEFSKFATILDIGAVGSIAVQNLITHPAR